MTSLVLKIQTISYTFSESRIQTSTVNKRPHSVVDKSEVSVEDSPSSPSKSLRLTATKDLVSSTRRRSRLSATSSPDQPITTFQSGSLTDKRTQSMETGHNSSPTTWIP